MVLDRPVQNFTSDLQLNLSNPINIYSFELHENCTIKLLYSKRDTYIRHDLLDLCA